MNLNIREMLPKERDYAYTQSYQLMSQSGCIALMRGDFGNGGRTFYPDYEDQIKQYRTDEFAAEFDSVIKEFYEWVSWLTVILCSNTAAPVPTGGLWEISAANTGIGLILTNTPIFCVVFPRPATTISIAMPMFPTC